MSKQTTIRLPEELADEAEAVTRVRGTSVNVLIIEALGKEIERVPGRRGFHQPCQATPRARS